MLRRRIIAAAVLGAIVILASFAILHARTASGPSQSAQLATTVPEGTPPPFPQNVVSGPAPAEISGNVILGPAQRCTQQSTHMSVGVHYRVLDAMLAELAAKTDEIVVATAVRQVAYWQKSGDNWQPMTMTEYHVTNVVKGNAGVGAWLQIADAGASSDLIPACKNLAYIIYNEPLPTLNQQYVLFVKVNPKTGDVQADTERRFPVIGGRVVTEAALHPAAGTSVLRDYQPELLDTFLGALRPGGSFSP